MSVVYHVLEKKLLAAVEAHDESVESLVRIARQAHADVRAVDVKIAAMNLVNKGEARFTEGWALSRQRGQR